MWTAASDREKGAAIKLSRNTGKAMVVSLALATTLVLAVAGTPAAAARAWRITKVDSLAGDWSNTTSLALDAAGNPHVSHYEFIDATHGHLKFAWSNDGGATWPSENVRTVDAKSRNVGGHSSLALDAAGNPRISYYDLHKATLKFAWSNNGGATWPASQVRTVDSAGGKGGVGWYTSLALDDQGNPRISYFDIDNGALKFAWSNDGGATWPTSQVRTIDSEGQAGRDTSLKLDAKGNPHIAYRTIVPPGHSILRYAWSNDGGASWPPSQVMTVDSDGDVGECASLALDARGHPRISYHEDIDVFNGKLKFARSDSGGASWSINTVDNQGDAGYYSSLVLDGAGNPHMSYDSIIDEHTSYLKYASSRDGGATWPAGGIEVVDPTGGTNSSMALDASGNPRVSYWYWNGSKGTIRFAYVPTPPTPTTFYLAEGTSAWGFSTYITIENPNDEDLTARIEYMDPDQAAGAGPMATREVALPALSQTTVDPRWDLGDTDFSTKVTCPQGKPIAVDRTVFWKDGGSGAGYHSSIGTDTPSETWYLPEGSSQWGFETWTLALNPGPREADVSLTYMTEEGPRLVKKTVPAHSRATWSMEQDIGRADASIKVTSSVPVVAERSMYRHDRREGSCSIGAIAPAHDFFLAEGATGYDVGFTTYVLVQNPGEHANEVSLYYDTAAGAVPGPKFTMEPNTRRTVRVNDTLPADTDVSTHVHGTKPLIAERAMYFDNGTGEAFHASIGLSAPHLHFMLPDGQTERGAETWTLIGNPNPGAARVRVTYLLQGGGAVTFDDEIPAGCRRTYNMAAKLGDRARASILVRSLDGARPVTVERSMYVDHRGAGANSIGWCWD